MHYSTQSNRTMVANYQVISCACLPTFYTPHTQPARLSLFPLGDFLVEPRVPWLVRWVWDTRTDKKGRLVREEVVRPGPDMAPGGFLRW